MNRFRMRHGLALVLGLLASAGAMGQADDYDLAPRQVAANTYVLLGAQEKTIQKTKKEGKA